MKKLFLLTLVTLMFSSNIFATGGLPMPKANMNFDEYNKYVMYESQKIYEEREQMYRTFHLLFQTVAVIFSALIPILLNSISNEKRKKRIITFLSIFIVIAVGASNVFNFKYQSTLYGTASIKLRKNYIEYDTDTGVYEKINNDTIKLKTYKSISENILYNTRIGLIEAMPTTEQKMPK